VPWCFGGILLIIDFSEESQDYEHYSFFKPELFSFFLKYKKNGSSKVKSQKNFKSARAEAGKSTISPKANRYRLMNGRLP
jgi:hypothetical protein